MARSECYGPEHLSEKLVGDYLSRSHHPRWIIATKFGHHFKSFMNRDDDFSISGVRAQLEASLKALRVETIDLYQFHSGSDAVFQNQELWSFLAEQKSEGKIRHIGLSILQKGSEIQAREAAKFGVESLQIFYNRLDRRAEEICFPHAQKTILAFLPACRWRAGCCRENINPAFCGERCSRNVQRRKIESRPSRNGPPAKSRGTIRRADGEMGNGMVSERYNCHFRGLRL
jgi:aryl-alcohol dehydrogenase-like predicted oxidoreductase